MLWGSSTPQVMMHFFCEKVLTISSPYDLVLDIGPPYGHLVMFCPLEGVFLSLSIGHLLCFSTVGTSKKALLWHFSFFFLC